MCRYLGQAAEMCGDNAICVASFQGRGLTGNRAATLSFSTRSAMTKMSRMQPVSLSDLHIHTRLCWAGISSPVAGTSDIPPRRRRPPLRSSSACDIRPQELLLSCSRDFGNRRRSIRVPSKHRCMHCQGDDRPIETAHAGNHAAPIHIRGHNHGDGRGWARQLASKGGFNLQPTSVLTL